jgi:hypothetical protein
MKRHELPRCGRASITDRYVPNLWRRKRAMSALLMFGQSTKSASPPVSVAPEVTLAEGHTQHPSVISPARSPIPQRLSVPSQSQARRDSFAHLKRFLILGRLGYEVLAAPKMRSRSSLSRRTRVGLQRWWQLRSETNNPPHPERRGGGVLQFAVKDSYRCEASPNRSAGPRLDGTV